MHFRRAGIGEAHGDPLVRQRRYKTFRAVHACSCVYVGTAIAAPIAFGAGFVRQPPVIAPSRPSHEPVMPPRHGRLTGKNKIAQGV